MSKKKKKADWSLGLPLFKDSLYLNFFFCDPKP